MTERRWIWAARTSAVCALALVATGTVPAAHASTPAQKITTLTGRLVGVRGLGRDNRTPVMWRILDTGTRQVDLEIPDSLAETHDGHDGRRVRVSGTMHGHKLAVTSMAMVLSTSDLTAGTSSASVATTTGDTPPLAVYLKLGVSHIAVAMLSFAAGPTQTQTVDEVRSTVFTGADSANAYLHEVSVGQMALTGYERGDGDVFGTYTLPPDLPSTTCDTGAWITAARHAMAAQGHLPSRYDVIIYSIPYTSACDFGGLGGGFVMINGRMDRWILTHELGHSAGLHHAASYACDSPHGVVSFSGSCRASSY
ncbi:MAG TPA: hypothetical protein VHJ79_07155, partial [Mycobacterium sp.]|nr:hypothetical protein [Mycobacterium sp.]